MHSTIIKINKIPSAKLVKKISEIANKYRCDIEIVVGSSIGNVKSSISFMSVLANIKIPAKVKICCSNSDDGVEALEDICKLLRIN